MDRFRARTPEPMRDARGDDDHVARLQPSRPAVDGDAERAGEHLVPLLLPPVDVFARGNATRDENRLVAQKFPVRVSSGRVEDDPLAGGRILEDVTWASHFSLSFPLHYSRPAEQAVSAAGEVSPENCH